MIHYPETQKNRPVGYNRPVKDAMELCGISVQELSSLLGISEDKCRKELSQEMPIIKKTSWIKRIYKHVDQPLCFTTWQELEDFIRQEIIRRGPDWLEEQPLIEGSSRHFHQQLNRFRPSRQEEEQNEKYN